MKSGFFLSGTAHGLLISFLVANGVFFMPERQYENLKKLDIMVLSEAEFDAMASLPPSIENLTINEFQEPKNLSLNLGLKSSLIDNFNGSTEVPTFSLINEPAGLILVISLALCLLSGIWMGESNND